MKTTDHSSPQTVLVTGATGYVAGWVIQRLLAAGHHVNATVRDLSHSSKTKPLMEIAESLPGELELFQADLMREGSFKRPMQGCTTVFHTASPFKFNVAHAQRDLIDPAVKGTRNVLTTVNQSDSVKRVVLTSSVVAMFGDNADLQGRALSEDDWNTTSTPEYGPYQLSKTVAEKVAWELAENADWTLTTINPSLVIGPTINPDTASESFDLIKKMVDGTLASGAPPLELGWVDVRDVADAHVAAMTQSSGRHIVCEGSHRFLDMCKALELGHPELKIPRKAIPKFMAWLFGPMIDKTLTRQYVSRNFGHPFRVDNGKSIEALGIDYTDTKASLVEMVQQMKTMGRL